MPKRIIWSPDSERDLEIILAYLSSKWEFSVARKFLELLRIYDTRQDPDKLNFK
jgi:plasmid stabilization system protein ParE